MKKNILLIFFLISYLYANSDKIDYYNDSKRGWHYYEKEPVFDEKKDNNIKKKEQDLSDNAFMKNIPLDNLNSLSVKEYTQTFTRAKEIATMKPTKENVMILQRMNKWQMEQSERFAKVWSVNAIENPALEFPEIAETKFGRNVKFEAEKQKTKKFFADKKDSLGFAIFMSSKDKEGYQSQKEVYDFIYREFGIESEFIDIDYNKDLIQRFKLTTSPENFFVYKNKKGEVIWHRIKAGFITQDAVIENTMFLFENAIMEKDK